MTYDDSMNLRNILWLAPLPDRSTKSWVAPGTLSRVIITALLLFAFHMVHKHTLKFPVKYYAL